MIVEGQFSLFEAVKKLKHYYALQKIRVHKYTKNYSHYRAICRNQAGKHDKGTEISIGIRNAFKYHPNFFSLNNYTMPQLSNYQQQKNLEIARLLLISLLCI